MRTKAKACALLIIFLMIMSMAFIATTQAVVKASGGGDNNGMYSLGQNASTASASPTADPVQPSGIVYSLPITLTNTQSVATPAPFQQMVTVNSAAYLSYEAPNLQNVEFFDSSGNIIPSWMESGNTNTATNTIYWLYLANGIAAGSSITVYMGFASLSTNLFNAQTTGEAPQLIPVYGEYDNGFNIFTNYQNFANSPDTLPAGWYGSGFETGWSYVQNVPNGWAIGNVNGHGVAYEGSNIPINSNLAVDIQVYYLQTTRTDWQAPFVDSASSTSYAPQGYAVTWLDNVAGWTSNAGATFSLTSGPGGNTIASTQNVFPTDIITVTDSTIYSNYTAIISGQKGILAQSGYLALSTTSSSYMGSVLHGYWVRTRALPPNGVMPKVMINGQTSSIPTQIVYSLPITLTNTQSVATPAPFQQMVTVNSAAYLSYEAPNLQNVEFFDSSGNIIPSWMESGNTNTATNTIYWLYLANGIAAGSSITVYMGFASLSTNLFNAQTTGEAPQLIPVYGEYDNGATVFIYYTNFAGNFLPSGWAAYDPSDITYSVNNGLTVTGSVSAGSPQIYYTNSLSNPYNTVIDAYVDVNSQSITPFLGYFYGPNGYGQNAGIGGDNGVWSIHNFNGGTGSSTSMGAGSLDSNWHVISYFPSASAGNGWLDYGHFTTYSSSFGFSGSKPGLFAVYGGISAPMEAQWFRQRSLPPGGVMPAVAFNGQTTPSVTVACSPNPAVAGSPITCTATVSGSNPTGIITWSTNGTTGSFSPSSTSTLSSGSCSITYTDTSSGIVLITAKYSGDSNNAQSSSNTILTLTAPSQTLPTKCVIVASPNPAAVGTSVDCWVNVIGSGKTSNPSGTIIWSTSDTSGYFSPSPYSPTPSSPYSLYESSNTVYYTDTYQGPVTITASYGGDGNNAPSSASTTLTLTAPLSMEIIATPSETDHTVPFSITFTAVPPSGATGPYSVSWIITSPVLPPAGDSYTGVNPLTYTFKYAGTYSITATITDSKSNTFHADTTINAVGSSSIATFEVTSGDDLRDGTPYLTISQSGQADIGTVTLSSSKATLETDVKFNWPAIVLPDPLLSFLGFSNPWYTISVTDGAGDSATVADSLIQVGYDDTQPIVASFPFNPLTTSANPFSLWQTITFKASPTSSLALTEDFVSAAFAAAGVKLADLSMLDSISMQLDNELIANGVNLLADSTNYDKMVADTHIVLDDLGVELLKIGAGMVGLEAAELLNTGHKALDIASNRFGALGAFTYDIMGVISVCIAGDKTDTYTIDHIEPLLSTVVDPNETLNVVLSTPQGDVGYVNGVWENTGNLTGFIHTDVMNNNYGLNSTYGFAIPITTQVYNANLTISGTTGGNTPYNVSVNWGNETQWLNGTITGQEQQNFSLAISGSNLGLQRTNGGQANILNIEIIAIAAAVIVVATVAVIVWHARKKKH